MNARSILLRLHLLVGCIAAPFLLIAGLSGAVLVFGDAYTDRVTNARVTQVDEGSGPTISLSAMQDSLRRAFPGADVVGVSFASETRNTWGVDFVSPAHEDGATVYVDPWTGRIVGRIEDTRSPLRWAHDLHTRLMTEGWGKSVVAWASVALVFLALTGLWLWWPGKIVRVRRGVSGRRVVFELHNAIGGFTWVFMLIFGATGMVIHWDRQAGDLLAAITGAPVAPRPPKPDSTCAGQPIVSLDLLRANLNAAAPGAYATSIQTGPKSTDPVVARMKYPEDKTPAGRTLVVAERCSGKVAWVLDARKAPFAYRAVRVWNRSIHTGDVYGWPTRILAALMALLLPVMTLTGPMIWWMRRGKRARAGSM